MERDFIDLEGERNKKLEKINNKFCKREKTVFLGTMVISTSNCCSIFVLVIIKTILEDFNNFCRSMFIENQNYGV